MPTVARQCMFTGMRGMIFKWLRDARYAPGSAQGAVDAPVFLPVEIVSPTRSEVARAVLPVSTLPGCLFEIEISADQDLLPN